MLTGRDSLLQTATKNHDILVNNMPVDVTGDDNRVNRGRFS